MPRLLRGFMNLLMSADGQRVFIDLYKRNRSDPPDRMVDNQEDY
jgi:hypothetical protein